MPTGIENRLYRLEKLFEQAQCVCEAHERQLAFVVVRSDSTPEEIRASEDAANVTCPVHGLVRSRTLVRLTEADAAL